jgi:hypothetical protein
MSTAPTKFRTPIARGILRKGEQAIVDREAKVIHNYAVTTRGEALGHGVWLDKTFLSSVVAEINSKPIGFKSRFTHPGMCADGLGTYLGRTKDAWLDGDVVRADLHIADVASKSPSGDLAEYVMDLAEEDPESFGASIVFDHNRGAEKEFAGKNSSADGAFTSPDKNNAENLPHARLAKLYASDVVDDPAANPGGFFSNGDELAARAEASLAWCLGLSEVAPDGMALGGIDPERARVFTQSFLQRHNVALQQLSATVADAMAGATVEGGNTMQEVKPEAPPVVPAIDLKAEQTKAHAEGVAAERARFKALSANFKDRPAFILEQFDAGNTVEQAALALKDLLITEQAAEIAKLKAGVPATPPAGGAQPASFGAGAETAPQTFGEMVKTYRAENNGVTNSAAAKAVAATPEGAKAYNKSIGR